MSSNKTVHGSNPKSETSGILETAEFTKINFRCVVVLRQSYTGSGTELPPFSYITEFMNWYFKKEWTVEQVALHYLKLRKEHFGDAPTPYDSPFAVVVENQKIEPHQKVTGMCRSICEQYDEFIKNYPKNYPERYGGKLPGVDQYWEELAKEQNPDFTAQAELLEGVRSSWSPQMNIDNRLFDNNGGKDFGIRHPDGSKTTHDKVKRYKANKANAAAKNNENYKLADPNSEKAKLLGKIQ